MPFTSALPRTKSVPAVSSVPAGGCEKGETVQEKEVQKEVRVLLLSKNTQLFDAIAAPRSLALVIDDSVSRALAREFLH